MPYRTLAKLQLLWSLWAHADEGRSYVVVINSSMARSRSQLFGHRKQLWLV